METDEETSASTVRQLEENVRGLNADQILVSSYFGLSSSRAPGFVDYLRELSIRADKGDTNAALEFLRALSTGSETRSGSAIAAPSSPGTVRSPDRKGLTRPRRDGKK